MKKYDYIEKELKTQLNRLKYIDAMLENSDDADFLPRRVFIEPTNMCNCKCMHCPNPTHMTRKRGFMDFDLYKKIIDDLGDLWPYITINLYQQGEPLLHPRIFDMIDYANEQNFFTEMNTNMGALKKKDIPNLLRVNYLKVAIDSGGPESYRTIKGVDNFGRVLDNLLDFMEAWGETATPEFFPPDVNFLCQKENRHEAEIFQEMFERLPVGHVTLFGLHNFTGPISEGDPDQIKQQNTPREEQPICNTPWDYFGINHDGETLACIYDYDARYTLGNAKDTPVLEMWNNKLMRTFRRGLLDRDFESIEKKGAMCSVCSIRWMEDYWPPKERLSEIGRMEKYLSAAVHRVADSEKRHEEAMQRWEYLKANRDAWVKEFSERISEVAPCEDA